MMNDLLKYGAAATKARAMHGKLLTAAQWESLMAAEDLRALRELLRRSPAWDTVGAAEAEEGALIRALADRLEDDCRRLGYFLNDRDRETFRMLVRHQMGGERPMSPEEYQRWWSTSIRKNDSLRRIVGAEVDALNLVYVLRLRRFSKSAGRAREYLIPIRHELKDPLIDRLLRASGEEAVLDILKNTRWGGAFQSLAPGELEKEYQRYMELFCRRILTAADAGFAVVQAFLPLKDMERRKLTRLIGAVAHGVDPHVAV